MCFSATASFVAGGALSATGILTLSKARERKELPLASIPLLFGIQQLIDGVVWISFGVPSFNTAAIYAYSLFAFVVWPIFIPLTLILIETNRVRKEILEALSLVGLFVGLFLLYFILFGTVTAHIANHCVVYVSPHPYRFVILAFFLVAICGSFFVSSKKILNLFGGGLLVSFIVSGWFYLNSFSSVWCFFAAILSVIIYCYFKSDHRA